MHYEQRAGAAFNFNFKFSHVCSEFCDVICDDAVMLYLQYSTQWDGLCHVGQMFDADGDGVPEKVYYNGYRAGVEIVGPGKPKAASAHMRSASRISPPPACRAAACWSISIASTAASGPSSAMTMMMRAGRTEGRRGARRLPLSLYRLRRHDPEMNKQPDVEKLHNSCAALDGRDGRLLNWITDCDCVAICSGRAGGGSVPARPAEGDSFPAPPLHNHCLFKQGVHLGELWYFTELAQWLGAHDRWRFQLTAPPLRPAARGRFAGDAGRGRLT